MMKVSMLSKFATKRRNSLTIPKISYPLTTQMKNPIALPKIVTSSRNYGNPKAEKENSIKKTTSLNKNQILTNQVIKKELVVDVEVSNLIYISANKNILKGEINVPPLNKLPPLNTSNFDSVFKEKIKICTYIFDFSSNQKQIQAKKEKLNALIEINDFLSKDSDAQSLTPKQQNLLFDMITKNIFNRDPFISNIKTFSLIIKPNIVERSWEHLSIVYKILNQFLLLFPDKFKIGHVKKAIRLLNIPDLNERENLVTFLKNYAKTHSDQFNQIWNLVKNGIINVENDIYTPYCIDPLISYITQLFLSNGTNIYIQILYTHLLPLYKHEQLFQYFTKLNSLIKELVANRSDDQLKVVQYLIKFFPHQNGSKQPLFATAITGFIQMMNYDDLNSISSDLFNFFALTVTSPNTKLAEVVSSIFMRQEMKMVICSNYELAIKTLYEPLKWASSFYWDKSIREQYHSALSTLMNAEMEFQANNAMSDFILSSELPTDKSGSKKDGCNKYDNKELTSIWATISRTAAKKDSSIDLTKSLFNIQMMFVRNEKK